MSKKIKQMEMDALRKSFAGVKNYVLLTSNKVSAGTDYTMRTALRKKGIRLQMVKNSLARRVLGEMGIELDGVWAGPTTLAYGAESVKDLSNAIDQLLK